MTEHLTHTHTHTSSIIWSYPLMGKEMATHSSILAWEIPWTEELGRGYSPWGHKGSYMT